MIGDIVLYGLALVGTVWVGTGFWLALIFLHDYIVEWSTLPHRVSVLEAKMYKGDREMIDALFGPVIETENGIPIQKKRRKKK